MFDMRFANPLQPEILDQPGDVFEPSAHVGG